MPPTPLHLLPPTHDSLFFYQRVSRAGPPSPLFFYLTYSCPRSVGSITPISHEKYRLNNMIKRRIVKYYENFATYKMSYDIVKVRDLPSDFFRGIINS